MSVCNFIKPHQVLFVFNQPNKHYRFSVLQLNQSDIDPSFCALVTEMAGNEQAGKDCVLPDDSNLPGQWQADAHNYAAGRGKWEADHNCTRVEQ